MLLGIKSAMKNLLGGQKTMCSGVIHTLFAFINTLCPFFNFSQAPLGPNTISKCPMTGALRLTSSLRICSRPALPVRILQYPSFADPIMAYCSGIRPFRGTMTSTLERSISMSFLRKRPTSVRRIPFSIVILLISSFLIFDYYFMHNHLLFRYRLYLQI